MMSQGPAPEPSRGGRSHDPSPEVIREIQGLVDQSCLAHERHDFDRSAALAGSALRIVGLYSQTGEPIYSPPPTGVADAVSPALQPFIGRALSLEATRILGRGDRDLAYRLARDATIIAPGSRDVLSVLRMVVRDNATRGEFDQPTTFEQLDYLAAQGVAYLAAAHGIVDGHAPMNLVVTREHHRIRVQREVEGVVRDHVAAAEQARPNGAIGSALCERGATIGLAALSLMELPDMMAGLTDLYRHDLPLGLVAGSAAARSTAALLEAVGIGYHRADMAPFALVTLALAVKLDTNRVTAGAILGSLYREFGAPNGPADVPRCDGSADISRWIAFRTREIPLGWNFDVRGNNLFADAFYRVRNLEPFTVDFGREVAHDYALIDREGESAATLYVRAAQSIIQTLPVQNHSAVERLALGLRAQSLLRYIESRREISREVIKPAHHLAGEFERVVGEAAKELPPNSLGDAEIFFRVIRSQHSA